MCDGYFLNLLK